MLDRVLITLVAIVGLGLLCLAWQFYKSRVTRALQPVEVSPGKPNLLFFTGEYCVACKFQQAPIIETISARFGNSIEVKQYDVSTHPELASRYKVLTLPTTIVVNVDGQVTHVNYGVAGQEKLEAQLLA